MVMQSELAETDRGKDLEVKVDGSMKMSTQCAATGYL